MAKFLGDKVAKGCVENDCAIESVTCCEYYGVQDDVILVVLNYMCAFIFECFDQCADLSTQAADVVIVMCGVRSGLIRVPIFFEVGDQNSKSGFR